MINKLILIGNLGKDPESRYTPSGTQVVNFSVATTRRTKDQSGNKITDWHNIVCFGKTAEFVSKHLKKGSKAYIEGSVQYSSYEKDGVKVYKTEIIANEVTNLSPREDVPVSRSIGQPMAVNDLMLTNDFDLDIPF